MATFQTRIEDYIGSFSDTAALTEFLTEGARIVADRLKPERLALYATDKTDGGSGITITAGRPLSAHKSGYEATLIPVGMKAVAADSDSIHYAVSTNPKWYIDLTKAYVLPGGGKIKWFAYPTVLYTASSITNFPPQGLPSIVLYSALQGCLQNINTSAANVLSNVSYTKPTQTFDVTQLETFLETNKDPKLAELQLGRLNHEMAELQADIQNEQSEESVKLQTYVNETQNLIALYDRLEKEYNRALETL